MKKNKVKKQGLLPENCLLEVNGESGFGDLTAVTSDRGDNPQNYKIYVLENKKIKSALQQGDKFLAKLIFKRGAWWAKPIARTSVSGGQTEKIYGVIEKRDGKYFLKSTEKNARMDYLLDNVGKAKEGDFVSVMLSGERKFKEARILKSFGPFNLSKAASVLVLEKYDIPDVFSDKVLKEAEHSPDFNRREREDITALPLVTIDGDDSKDFDDAVYAEKTETGFNLVVAIADVAFYVPYFSELDREAYKRGNSVYLPNMVIPMLPEKLSNDLCSLRPKVERACLACFMKIDKDGNLKSYDFKRAVMKSAARLTYREVQEAIDGKFNNNTVGLFKAVIQPLYEAYFALDKARKKRGSLEIEPNEITVKLDKNGNVKSVEKAEDFTSCRIIEEFMIAANVAAAKALKKSKLPVMYRVHEKPLEEKLKELEPLLFDLHLKLPDYPALKPEHLNKVLELCRAKEYGAGISDLILRLQCQAKYTPHNVGHFGLALTDYVHFTSPIRRYSDLLIHRALIKAYNMPEPGALDDGATEKLFEDIGEHLCVTERRAVNAERDMVARFLSSYLEPSVGGDFDVKISGLTTAGVFVQVESLGAEGLIPMRSLPDDDYVLEAGGSRMKGMVNGRCFIFGDKIKARLLEASPITGGLIFKFVDETEGVDYYEKGIGRMFSARKPQKPKMPKPERKKKLKEKNKQKKNKEKKIKTKKK
ncbi:MAG: ribonuclease R family protein [Alphaproteobacteria bacterium]